jgi:hypothetical protein
LVVQPDQAKRLTSLADLFFCFEEWDGLIIDKSGKSQIRGSTSKINTAISGLSPDAIGYKVTPNPINQ